jgi:hypothetical protein
VDCAPARRVTATSRIGMICLLNNVAPPNIFSRLGKTRNKPSRLAVVDLDLHTEVVPGDFWKECVFYISLPVPTLPGRFEDCGEGPVWATRRISSPTWDWRRGFKQVQFDSGQHWHRSHWRMRWAR